jgi:Permuted papain-like amidase enzyme, YaeF/YiiX, C92 family
VAPNVSAYAWIRRNADQSQQLISVSLCLLAALLAIAIPRGFSPSAAAESVSDAEPHAAIAQWQSLAEQLRDGDLIFRTGRDLASRIVLAQRKDSNFSHVGVVVMHAHEPWVVHAVPAGDGEGGGVVWQSLAHYAAPTRAIALGAYRPTALTPAGQSAMRDYLISQLGRPFDDSFVYSDDARQYCTELAMKALGAAGLDANAVTPRVRVPLHDESIATPDALSRWSALVRLAPRPNNNSAAH